MTSISISSNISSQITSNIFSKLDTSNQGSIDATSLSKALSDSSDGEVSDLVSNMDTDGDSKITKSELSKGIENLFNQLQSAHQQASRAQGMPPPPPGGAGGPPPPRNGDDDEDTGLTQDQMTEIASSTDDSKLSELLSSVASNFEAADTNGDGKVTQQEAMTYQKSQRSDSQKQLALENTSQDAMAQVDKLLKSYGLDSNSPTQSILSDQTA